MKNERSPRGRLQTTESTSLRAQRSNLCPKTRLLRRFQLLAMTGNSGLQTRSSLVILHSSFLILHCLRGVLYRLHNMLVSGAAAQVAFESVADFCLGRIRIAL